MHVKLFRMVKVKEISLLMHLRIISAEIAFVYILEAGWSHPNENNALTPGCSHGKKKNHSLRQVKL